MPTRKAVFKQRKTRNLQNFTQNANGNWKIEKSKLWIASIILVLEPKKFMKKRKKRPAFPPV